VCRQPTVHPRLLRRFPDHPRQSGRGLQDHAGSIVPFLHHHRPTARAGRSQRTRGSRLGLRVRVAEIPIPMSAVLRTRTISEMSGFMKALVDAESDRILGFSMLGPAPPGATSLRRPAAPRHLSWRYPPLCPRMAFGSEPPAEGEYSLRQPQNQGASHRGPQGPWLKWTRMSRHPRHQTCKKERGGLRKLCRIVHQGTNLPNRHGAKTNAKPALSH